MKRIPIQARNNWEQKISEQGFLFYASDSYYSEKYAYEFTRNEIEQIETATAEIFDMCMEVVEHVINKQLWDEFFIPKEFAKLIEWSWKEDQPSIYGRFDLAMNNGEIKLLEFNADTPTSLLECSVIQWFWLQEYNNRYDQFNSVHEKLLDHLKLCKKDLLPGPLYFSCLKDNLEDYMNVKYLQDVAEQAGLETEFIYIEDISMNMAGDFITPANMNVRNIFKLYPYEWMFNEEFGKHLDPTKENCYWIEPAYKAILSNKMLLKYIYELFPDSPYILPCTFSTSNLSLEGKFVKKPVFSREGANISIVAEGKLLEQTGGDYGEEGFLYQEYFELPVFGGAHPIIGSWVIGGKSAGIGIRESDGLITNNTSRFCPHYFV